MLSSDEESLLRAKARVFIAAIAASVCFNVCAQEKTIRLAMMEEVRTITDKPLAILRKVYANLGYELVVVPMPFARSVMAANNGDFDGEVARLPYIEESAKNLLRVPVAVNVTEYVPYILQGTSTDLSSWDKINASGLSIGARRGAQLTESSVRQDRLRLVNSYDSLLAMLLLHRIDVAIAPKGQLEEYYLNVHESNKPDISKIQVLPVFASMPVYHYLHKKNAALVPMVEREIKRINSGQSELVEGSKAQKTQSSKTQ
ncbi:substrate-binding periplasmic protein [Roseateles albus]|uniref:Transporter substrate-binding domain-containing protein n=1 Tax=Roseateles albus TaxID=2987525 RepID=A0ABT5KGD0_9BURK|nr:transporter substrate-binding domain-containing protein [Roseateles albus]MDC8772514.1 transporter substrate-binding domain-containing protein [Roseateles albus]